MIKKLIEGSSFQQALDMTNKELNESYGPELSIQWYHGQSENVQLNIQDFTNNGNAELQLPV